MKKLTIAKYTQILEVLYKRLEIMAYVVCYDSIKKIICNKFCPTKFYIVFKEIKL